MQEFPVIIRDTHTNGFLLLKNLSELCEISRTFEIVKTNATEEHLALLRAGYNYGYYDCNVAHERD